VVTASTALAGPTPISSPPAIRTVPVMRAPFTRVPLRLPRSSTTMWAPRRVMRACIRDTLSCSTMTVAPRDRPKLISAPSGSSMTRVRSGPTVTIR